MSYFIRVLGKNVSHPKLEDLQQAAEPGVLEVEEWTDGEWSTLILKLRSDVPIALLEVNPVEPGKLGADELEEFIEEVGEYKPVSAADWLRNYLPSVKVIYAFQLLGGTEVDDGFEILHSVYGKVWSHAGGILQADGEGFSDEAGHTILWQFSDNVTGEWNVGVLAKNGRWEHFKMDLGNEEHRQAFWRGEVPDGVTVA